VTMHGGHGAGSRWVARGIATIAAGTAAPTGTMRSVHVGAAVPAAIALQRCPALQLQPLAGEVVFVGTAEVHHTLRVSSMMRVASDETNSRSWLTNSRVPG